MNATSNARPFEWCSTEWHLHRTYHMTSAKWRQTVSLEGRKTPPTMIHPSNLISGTWKSAPGPSVFSKKSTVACSNVKVSSEVEGPRGFPLGFLDLEAKIGTTNKIKQDQIRCLRDPGTKKDTEVTTNFSNTVETRNTDGVRHKLPSCWLDYQQHMLIFNLHELLYRTCMMYICILLIFVIYYTRSTTFCRYHITRSNLWQIQNNMMKTAFEIWCWKKMFQKRMAWRSFIDSLTMTFRSCYF